MTDFSRLLFVFINLIIFTTAQWDIETAEDPLPYVDNAQAVGYWNGKIYLLGGSLYPNQFTEYDIATGTFTDRGSDVVPYSGNGHSQHYTQIDDKLYWIEYNTVYSYSFTDDSYAMEFVSPTGGDYACLASYQDLILVIGGFGGGVPLRSVQVFDVKTRILTQTADLIDRLRDFTCAVDSKRGIVYVAAGMANDARGWMPLIQKLVIGDDITTAVWAYNDESLSYGTWGVRTVYADASDSIIFVSGGGSTAITRLDAATGQVTREADLNYECPNTALIYAEETLYAFGGYDYESGDSINTVQIIKNPDLFSGVVTTEDPTTTSTTEVVVESTEEENEQEAQVEEEGEVEDSQSDDDDDDGTDPGSGASMEAATVRESETSLSLPLLIVGGMCTTFILLICIVFYCWVRYKRVVKENDDMVDNSEFIDVGEGEEEKQGQEGAATTDNVAYDPKVNGVGFRLPPIIGPPVIQDCTEDREDTYEDDSMWAQQNEQHVDGDKETAGVGGDAYIINMGQNVESPGKGQDALMNPLPSQPMVQVTAESPQADNEDFEYYYEYYEEDGEGRKVTQSETVDEGEVTTGDVAGMGDIKVEDFTEWKSYQVLYWILSIEEGVFAVYEKALMDGIFSRQLKGMDLETLEVEDMEAMGVSMDAHRKLLKKNIMQLVAYK